MSKQLIALIPLACAGLAHAHPGHGMPGVLHWHAGDVSVLLAAAAVAVLGLWLASRK